MAVFHSRLVIMISHDIFSFSYSNFNFSYSDFVISRSDFPISHSHFSISHIDRWDSIGDFQLNPLLSCLACHNSNCHLLEVIFYPTGKDRWSHYILERCVLIGSSALTGLSERNAKDSWFVSHTISHDLFLIKLDRTRGRAIWFFQHNSLTNL